MAMEKVVIACGTNIVVPRETGPTGTMTPKPETPVARSPLWDADYKSFWVLDRDGTHMVDVPPEFYANMPPDAKCVFSTNGGTYGKKYADFCQPRRVSLWLGLKVYEKSCAIRGNFTRFMKDVKVPTTWTDLYQYFDSYDLWNNGIYNCWNVINLIAEDNKLIEPLVREDKLTVVDEWIDQWMSAEVNQGLLEGWDQTTDILLILHQGDFGCGGVGQLDAEGLEMLREALAKRYQQHMTSERVNQVQTWLGRFLKPRPVVDVGTDNRA